MRATVFAPKSIIPRALCAPLSRGLAEDMGFAGQGGREFLSTTVGSLLKATLGHIGLPGVCAPRVLPQPNVSWIPSLPTPLIHVLNVYRSQ